MKQLIARIDDELHRRLKERAASEGRSVNALVTDAIRSVVGESEREQMRRSLRKRGLLVVPPRPRGRIPTRDEAIASGRGAGTAVSDALREDRDSR